MDRREYKSKDITVVWEPKRCVHSAECVRHLPDVFDPEARPWIHIEAESAEAIASTVRRCPTGALQYRPEGDLAAEQPDDQNTVVMRPNGPLYVRGQIEINGIRETRVALCRCGASARKPFCDNSHRTIGFQDPAHGTEQDGGEATGSGMLRIAPTVDGPLELTGPVLVGDSAGTVLYEGNETWLCRCGASETKPFCDGSHKRVAFRDSLAE